MTATFDVVRRATDAIDRFNYALAGRDLTGEWTAKMPPEEFDRRGHERRLSRPRPHRFTAGTIIMCAGVLALYAFVIAQVVWGWMA